MSANPHAATDPAQMIRILKGQPEAEPNQVEHLRAEVARLRQENTSLRCDNAALVKLITNPHLKEASKILVVRLAVTAKSKASRGQDVDDAGRVRISASEIAGDHRRRPEPGERRAPVNPDGSPFLMPRSSVKGLLAELRDTHRVIDFSETKVRKVRAANNLPYADTEYLVTPGASLAETLKAAAWFTPATPTVRPYTRQAPCIHCGEVHGRTVVCDGCGAVIRTIPVPLEQGATAHVDAAQDKPPTAAPPIATNYRAIPAVENSSATNYRAMGNRPPMHQPLGEANLRSRKEEAAPWNEHRPAK
jgi:hypothetical protein